MLFIAKFTQSWSRSPRIVLDDIGVSESIMLSDCNLSQTISEEFPIRCIPSVQHSDDPIEFAADVICNWMFKDHTRSFELSNPFLS